MNDLLYGQEILPLKAFDGADMLVSKARSGKMDSHKPEDIIKDAFLEHSKGPLEELFKGKKAIGLVINDRNRPTPTYLLLEHFQRNEPWLMNKVTKLHIATGTHQPPSEDDLKHLLRGTYDLLRERVHIHDARDEPAHAPFGRTSRGTELRFDRELLGHDMYLFINSVEPHYFAGFTGGRKSLIPGMAAYSSVESNHSFALSPGSKTLGLKGNPVHEDMVEAAGIFLKGRDHLSVQMVQGIGSILTSMVVGDIFTAFEKAVEKAKAQFCVPIGKKYDIVISFARPPMDRTLYQAQKAIENGKLALKDGGIIILAAKCSEGIGQPVFWELLTSSSDPRSIMDRIAKEYKLGYHKAAKIIALSLRSRIFAATSIAPDELRKGFITGFPDPMSAFETARQVMGKDAKVLVIPDGTMTVPMIEG